MLREHLALDRERAFHTYKEIGFNRDSEPADAAHRVGEVEVRDSCQCLGFRVLTRLVIRGRRPEAGITYENTRRLVIAMVIGGRGGDHEVGTNPPQQLGYPTA